MADYGARIPANGRVSCASSNAYNFGTGDFTLTMLVKTTDTGCVLCRQSGTTSPGFSVTIGDGGVITFVTGSSGDDYATFTERTAVSDGYWHHIACVRQSGQLSIYLDRVSVQVGISGGAATPTDVSNTLEFLMADDHAGDQPFDGILEDVTVWNRALTPAQLIPTMYNQLEGDEPGLVGFYPMDGDLDDLSPTHNTGVGTNVTFVQIFHCACAYGDNDFSYANINNDQGELQRKRSRDLGAAANVSRTQLLEIEDGAQALLATVVTSADDLTFPAGITMKITDPDGVVYNTAKNTERVFVNVVGGRPVYVAVLDPKPGTWIYEITAPGDASFQAICHTVPSGNIAGTFQDTIEPIFGDEDEASRRKRSSWSAWNWVAASATVLAVGVATVATLGTATPVLLGAVAAMSVTSTAIAAVAVTDLGPNPTATQLTHAATNMAQLTPPGDAAIITGDANSDEGTKPLYDSRTRELYPALITASPYTRVAFKGLTSKRKSKPFEKSQVEAALLQPNVVLMTSSSHGKETYINGANLDSKILKVGSYNKTCAKGKMFHFLACNAGAQLGPDLVSNGAKAFFGYNDKFQFGTSELTRDVFVYCDARIDLALVEGKTAGQAHQAAIDAFNAKIKEYGASSEMGKALTHNLGILVGPLTDLKYGDKNATL